MDSEAAPETESETTAAQEDEDEVVPEDDSVEGASPEATREIIKGIRSHYEVPGEPPPDHVNRAIEAVGASARGAFSEKDILRYHAKLRSFGDAVGAACWRKGYRRCRQKMLPRQGTWCLMMK